MNPLEVTFLGEVPYLEAWELQKAIHARRVADEIPDQLLLLHHPHTLTVGTRGGKPGTRWHNLQVPREELEARGVALVESDRGGDVTWHGPGQLVAYPIVGLQQYNRDVGSYVRRLEQTVLLTLDALGIQNAKRAEGYPGVWIGEEKISAVGARIRKWATMHGFSLNVRGPLEGFSWIVPCGLEGRWVTSLEKEAKGPIPSDAEIRKLVADAASAAFQRQYTYASRSAAEMMDLHRSS